MTIILQTTKKMSTERLMELAELSHADDRDEAGIVLDACLQALELRISEADYVAFCVKLEA